MTNIAIFSELLRLKGLNSLVLRTNSLYFAVAHLRLLRELCKIKEIRLSLSALIIEEGVGYSSNTAIAAFEQMSGKTSLKLSII